MDTQGQPWEWSVSALSPLNGTRNRKPPCARLGVPAGTAMQGKRQNWISLPSITTATLAAFPWRSSHPHRICSFQTESKEGGGGERSENSHVQRYKQITKLSLHMDSRLTRSTRTHMSENSPSCTAISADLQEIVWPGGLGK